jgi:hypothetical protein
LEQEPGCGQAAMVAEEDIQREKTIRAQLADQAAKK